MSNKEIRRKTFRMIKENAAVLFGCAAVYGAIICAGSLLVGELPIPSFFRSVVSIAINVLIIPLSMAVCFRIPMMLWKNETPVFRDIFSFCGTLADWIGAVRYGAPFVLAYNALNWLLTGADKLQKSWLAAAARGDAADIVSGTMVDYISMLDAQSALAQNEQLGKLSAVLTVLITLVRMVLFFLNIRVQIGAYYLYAEGACSNTADGARRSFDMMRGWIIRFCWLGLSTAWWPMFICIVMVGVVGAAGGNGLWITTLTTFVVALLRPFSDVACAGLIKNLLYGSKEFKKKKVKKIKAPKY